MADDKDELGAAKRKLAQLGILTTTADRTYQTAPDAPQDEARPGTTPV